MPSSPRATNLKAYQGLGLIGRACSGVTRMANSRSPNIAQAEFEAVSKSNATLALAVEQLDFSEDAKSSGGGVVAHPPRAAAAPEFQSRRRRRRDASELLAQLDMEHSPPCAV